MNAFNGDTFLKQEFEKLIKLYGIKTIIETGTYHGVTTEEISKMVENVVTIEIRQDFFDEAFKRIGHISNIKMYLGDAPLALDEILGNVLQPIMIFLDSHWGYPTPLKGEFEAIAKHGVPAAICVHDMKNPNDPTMGFDVYDDQEYTFEAIQPYIELVYGKDGYNYYFNTQATGSRRGALFITQKV